MTDALRRVFAGRPTWANLLFLFCSFMTVFYMPYDFFVKPMEIDEEVWLGFVLHGRWAKLTEPIHWAIYAAGAYGFYHLKSWLWPWAALYTLQIAIAMVVWNRLDPRGSLAGGVITGAVFAAAAIGLWRARPVFRGRNAVSTTPR